MIFHNARNISSGVLMSARKKGSGYEFFIKRGGVIELVAADGLSSRFQARGVVAATATYAACTHGVVKQGIGGGLEYEPD